MSRIDAWLMARRRGWLVVLCVVGGARVAWLSLATPILNNIDEVQHLDTVIQYADGRWPLGVGPFTTEARLIAFRHATLAYIIRHDDPLNPPEALEAMARIVRTAPLPDSFLAEHNHELSQPPLYYVFAGALYRELRDSGAPPRIRPFLLRLINVPILVLTLLASSRLATLVAPERPGVLLGAPLLVAFFPQDVFTQIGNDSMSAAACAWALVWLLTPIRSGRLTPAAALLAGSGAAAAVLTKWSNVPILALVPLTAMSAWCGAPGRMEGISPFPARRRQEPLKPTGGRWWAAAVLIVAALLPIALWSARCRLVAGDFTATTQTERYLRWTQKPVGQWLNHPIFRPAGWNPLQVDHGLSYMLYETITSYWRGELVWRLERVRLVALDVAYYAATLVCFVAALVALRRGSGVWRAGLLVLGAFCALGVAELIVLSIRYDFGTCFYPSRALPYMCSGRLILGSLAAFAVVIVVGLSELLRPLARSVGMTPVLIAACLIMTAGELLAATALLGQRCSWWNP